MFQHCDLVLQQKLLERQGVVCWHIVLVKNPWAVLPHFRSSSHPFMKVCQNLLVADLVNGLTFRHPIHMNNSSAVEENDHHCFKFGFALPCFLLPRWTGALPVFRLVLTFWAVLKKTTIYHKLLRSLKSLGLFSVLKNVSTNVLSNFLLFRREESQHHLWTHFFHVEIVSKICRTVSLSILINSATARMLRWRLCRTISQTFLMLASVFDVLGRPGRWSSPVSFLPSLNL